MPDGPRTPGVRAAHAGSGTRLSRRDSRRALATVRDVLHGRRDRPSTADRAYVIYVVILVALIVVFPFVRALMIGLAVPEIAAWTRVLLSATGFPLLCIVLTFAVIALGAFRGPVVPSAAYLDRVVASPLDRGEVLVGSFWRSGAVLGVILLLGAASVAGAEAFAGGLDVLGTTFFLLGAALGSVQLSVLWLLGQRGGRVRGITLAVVGAGALLVLGALLVPGALLDSGGVGVAGGPAGVSVAAWLGPWGWSWVLWQAVTAGVTPATVLALGLMALATVSVLAVHRILSRLASGELRSQSDRWNAALSLARTGDVRSASARLQSLPHRGRHWKPLATSNAVWAIVLRDLRGIRRYPVRAAVFVGVSLGTGALFTFLFTGTDAAPVLAYGAALISYFAVGGWASGLRLFTAMVGSSSPYGLSARAQTLAHLIVPGTITLVLTMLGGAILAAIVPGVALADAAVWIALIAVLNVTLQAFSALKGTLPIELLAPVPTPVGDASVFSVALWLADAVCLSLLVGGVVTALLLDGGSLVVNAGIVVVAIAVLAAWADYRLQSLARPV